MKKILSLMLCVMTFTATLAQTESEHLTFKGVPIDGSLTSFVQKMKQKGFTYLTSLDNVVVMKGTFSGYNDCKIYVYSSEQKDLVYNIGVIFPETESWGVLSSNYFNLKEMLTTKYGEPSDCTETFDAYSQPRDDQMKMFYAQTDKCKYETVFALSNGWIKLIISHVRANYQDTCYVSLIYTDFVNYMNNQSKAIDDL